MSGSLSCYSQKNHLVFSSLCLENIFHGIFARRGGVSPAPWNSLNVSFGLGDDDQNVITNRNTIKKALGINILVSARQVHGTKVHVISKQPDADLVVDGHDALITKVTDIGLMVQHADCQAVLLFDPIQRAVGIMHVGWRGSAANIIGTTVEAMAKTFATNPADLQTAISPSLGPCCAEFVHYRTELPPCFHGYQIKQHYFDFWAISHDQLCETGILSDNIAIANQCTVCNKDYFSYRRDKNTGRCASVIGLCK